MRALKGLTKKILIVTIHNCLKEEMDGLNLILWSYRVGNIGGLYEII